MATFDIGPIPNLVNNPKAKTTFDDYQKNRGFPAKYRFFSNTVVCYYHNRCDTTLPKELIVKTVQVLETYIEKIRTLLSLPFPRLQQGKLFPLYISNTGLHPEPGDCVNGVVGAASDYMMILHPDVIKNIENDPTVIVHELGHGFLSLGGIQTWLEESLCEFLTWVFIPSYQSFYDTARDAIFKKSWINPLSITNKPYETRYNPAVFWAFIADVYGTQRIGEIANNAFKSQNPNVHEFALLADYLKTSVHDLALKWAISCVTLSVFKPLHQPYLQKYFAGKGFTKKPPFTWNIASFNTTDIETLIKRTELYGFEVSQPFVFTTPLTPPKKGQWIIRYLTSTEVLTAPKPNQTCRLMLVRIAM